MLEIISIAIIILVWTAAMVWAYWGNGGMEDFKEGFKKVLDRIRWM